MFRSFITRWSKICWNQFCEFRLKSLSRIFELFHWMTFGAAGLTSIIKRIATTRVTPIYSVSWLGNLVAVSTFEIFQLYFIHFAKKILELIRSKSKNDSRKLKWLKLSTEYWRQIQIGADVTWWPNSWLIFVLITFSDGLFWLVQRFSDANLIGSRFSRHFQHLDLFWFCSWWSQ